MPPKEYIKVVYFFRNVSHNHVINHRMSIYIAI